jgi:prepilin-type N-terminal cleavage/methylation domain-containing protein
MEKFLKRAFKLEISPGFTLAELLVVLGVLGVIAAFTIPKLLDNQYITQRRAVERETFAALSGAVQSGFSDRTLPRDITNTSTTTYVNYMANKLNAVKVCPNNMTAQGCRSTITIGFFGNQNWLGPGFVLPNGATVLVQKQGQQTPQFLLFLVDWNGDNTPNATAGMLSNDYIAYYINLSDIPVTFVVAGATSCTDPNIPSGRLMRNCNGDTLHRQIFGI